MSLWVKICGTTSLVDARLAVEAGADAVGFVFAPSARQVNAAQVAAIVAEVPEAIERIGVFTSPDAGEIAAAVRASGLTGVQVHAGGGVELTAALRAEFGRSLRILRVVHFGADAAGEAARVAADPSIDGILVDSRVGAQLGGTGVAYDWATAARTIFAPERGVCLVAAGGLSPDNVAEAIATLRPWGVDVVSGVEAAPGRKDMDKVRAFVSASRAAERG
jgi:phosphoribosylanthranilate isomerase